MAEAGESLSAVPPRPLELSILEELAEHDRVVAVVPLVSRGTSHPAAVTHALVQLRQAGILIEYDTHEGWVVQRRVTAAEKSDPEVFRDLVRQAIDWQQDRDGLVTALYQDGRRDLRDLLYETQ